MGISTNIVGFVDADEKWHAMKKVWDACIDAEISPPDEVYDFFDGKDPNGMPGAEIDISEAIDILRHENQNGFKVSINKLPEKVTSIWFYNSW